jgi:hypothetical protein
MSSETATHKAKKQKTATTTSAAHSAPAPSIYEAPIDCAKHLRTTILCSNRVFMEDGISRHIAGFYKHILCDDVAERLSVIEGREMARRFESGEAAREIIKSSLREITGYMQYFSDNIGMIRKCFKSLFKFWDASPHEGRELICNSTLHAILLHGARYPNGLSGVLVTVFKVIFLSS